MQIPGYATTHELYRGPHCHLLRATDLATGQTVLLKVAAEAGVAHARRLRQQADILLRLGAAGLAPLAEFDFHGRRALVCADFPGLPLRDFLDRQDCSLAQFFGLAESLAAALGAIHRLDLVHCDLHPGLILVDPASGKVRVADFSQATPFARAHQPVVSPQVLEGELAFMSPEQTGRMNRTIDYRSDLYSLGVLYYRMLTGRLPFEAVDAMAMVHCHIAQAPVAPESLRPQVPAALGQIVLKLLAKTAEERYQSAYGLQADLAECARQWAANGAISGFAPGRHDAASRFLVPEKLYGREAAVRTLEAAIDSADAGRARMVLVRGPSGIGKSNLVNEIHKLAARRQRAGYFVTGRCDQYRGNKPYDVLIGAFQQLVRQLLGESADSIAAWRRDLLAALGGNGQVIIELIPEVQWIIGPQPPLAALGPSETQNRFNAVFRSFVGIFARREHPFCLFLDDLQWADSATLRLIQTLLADAAGSRLLLIGACREQEGGLGSGLEGLLATLDQAAVPVDQIALEPLDRAQIRLMLSETLNRPEEEVESLAMLVHAKTKGLPFVINQQLGAMYAAGLIAFDAGAARWEWDTARIALAPISDNVVDLMVEAIRRRGAGDQHLLKVAAALGNRFDLASVALVAGGDAAATADQLLRAQQDGLIVRIGDSLESHGQSGRNAIYEFQHPRIQQAAYSLVEAAEKANLHCRVGRLLLSSMRQAGGDDGIFAVVDHLNAALALFETSEDRLELAALNLRAGRKAAGSIAYDTAAAYLGIGLACLDAQTRACAEHYGLVFELELLHATALANTGQAQRAHVLFERAFELARDAYDKATVCEQHSIALQNSGDTAQALKVIRRGLALFGIAFPDQAEQVAAETAAAFDALARAETILRFHALEAAGREDCLIGRLYDRCIIATYFTCPQQLGLVISRNVGHVLERGLTPEAGAALSWFAMLLGMSGMRAQSFSYAELALDVAARFDDPYFEGKARLLAHAQALCWKHPFERNEAELEAAFRLCHDTGDLQYASYASLSAYIASLAQGRDYQRVLRNCRHWHDYCEKYVPLELGQARIRLQAHQRLMGLEPIACDAEQVIEAYAADQNWTDVSESLVELARCAALFGQYEQGLAYCRRALPLLEQGAAGNLLLLQMFHVAGAVCCARLHRVSPGPALAAEAEAHLGHLRAAAALSPANFSAHAALAEAEWDLAGGRRDAAAAGYQRAMREARQHGYVLHEAWACELFAGMLNEEGSRLAGACVEEAERLYAECGAEGKAGALRARRGAAPRAAELHGFDLATIVKAAQAISGEIEPHRLIERSMQLMLENAGAQHGMLLLCREHELILHALAHDGKVIVLERITAACDTDINWTVVNFVARSGERVVLDNAAADGAFAHDPWMLAHRSRSVLCAPLLNQGQVTGILYLENRLAAGAFSPGRLAVLEVLASQAAISLRNAMLYADLRREQKRIRELNETLERRVATRTEEADRARRRLVDMTEALPLTVFQVRERDGEHIYTFVSENASEVLGVEAREIMANPGARWRTVLPEDRVQCEPIQQRALQDKVACEFHQRVQFGGRTRWIHSHAVAPQRIDDGWVWNGFWIDETDARMQEEELRVAKEQAEAATRAKSMFLANMSHEIRTPMNAIIGLSHLALRTSLDVQQRDYVSKIGNAGTSLLGIVNDILDFSKIEAGQMQLGSADFHLERVRDDLLAVTSAQIESKGLQLRFRIEPSVPPVLVGDAMRLGQILLNLINNALKFTEQGGIEVGVDLLEAVGEQVKLKFAVQDSGIGIGQAERERLFQPFTQADQSTSRKYGGTGLGLTICKSLVELMGGSIWVDSMAGVGSTFNFTAWFGQGADAPRPAQAPARQRRFDGMRVLLAEDNPINQQIAVELLRLAGVEVDLAEDGGRAVDLLRAGVRYDLVLMDVQMPGVDGYQATAAIRRDPAHAGLPIVAMTAFAMNEERQRCADAGMNDHIAKPIDPERLFDVLERWHDPAAPRRAAPPRPAPDTPAPDTPGFDLDGALARVGGNTAIYGKILARFVQDYRDVGARLDGLYRSGERAQAERLAHTVRGAAANLGAMRMALAAQALEEAIRAGADAEACLQAFAAAAAATLAEADALLEEAAAASRT
ncbi:MAG TPA: AAA family ATPase [Telluria sp.]|nr:AAA family ATPase [Telluria sp.]